jgi:SAM-dependent methyltransferase
LKIIFINGRHFAPQRVTALARSATFLARRREWTMLYFMTGSPDPGNALAAEWDQRYTGLAEYMSLVEPNALLLTEVGAMPPGRALDIGCGVGADAIWLAGQGWRVTALDVSQVALDHAAVRTRQAGVHVEWIQGRLEDVQRDRRRFDLVTAFYPALLHSKGQLAEHALLAAVADGGTLLVVHHADIDVEKAKLHGFDPADYLSHDDLAELLGDDWEVHVDRRRLREKPTGVEGQHTHDDVLRARRLR